MRITFIVGVFPPESEPSAVMASELVQNWSKNGHTVTVICPFPNRPHGIIHKGYKRRLWQMTESENVRILRVWSWFIGPKRRTVNRLLENFSFGVSSGIALIFLKKPDIVLIETWPILAQLIDVIASKIRTLRAVNYVKDLFPEALNAAGLINSKGVLSNLLLSIDNKILGSVACNVVISERMKELVINTRRDSLGKVYVIYDWLDLQYIKPYEGRNTWREKVGISKDEIVFMFAGTMGFASGVDILIEVAEILRNNSKIRIVCVGEGPLKEKILNEQKSRNLSNLTILGFQPRETVNEMQSAADAMLLITSPTMGTSSVPSKLITYLGVGKPVLCAAGEDSDIAYLVKTNNIGIVVPPGEAVKISEGIVCLASFGRESLNQKGLKAREAALRLYSLPRALKDFEELFRKIL